MSRRHGAAVVCTLHQPSASVFGGLDDVLLLAQGRAGYFGAAARLAAHLAEAGHPVPAHVSVAEWALELLSSDFDAEGAAASAALLGVWEARSSAALPPPAHGLLPLGAAAFNYLA